mmetsp:Transcript_25362/g.37931  ORF Transcript_25362/g.37931 Transcript_25362/m.37931 type:complete len:237 (-) Transcript_25362:277-987(-)|eukprot:CAMPEP_0203676246 /NCGR_PEP_ID=MMETSP0090-20130426/24013_1 /ASSEMBLY_ACC=CAM_ASM_001088 /TAXON_ID=426623 /ORGANISM="Chaetoceros affinis, Strain CCMP159" /LENGTH=236 /DNA_ID=CAMNT_0050542747 /DNA_START=112 /DNA_END=822 /DNA_ORIENTATION=-
MTDTLNIHLTPDEIAFTNAFNAQRMVLAGFAKCSSKEELHIVRDGFYLGIASHLHLAEYEPVRESIITDNSVAEAVRTENAFRKTVEAARKSSKHWDDLVSAVKYKATLVGSDLDDIWMTLENGRLEWLAAASAAHKIKVTLQGALNNQCGGGAMEGDVSDAKMIWMYALSLSIPSLKKECKAWKEIVQMSDESRPLVGYKSELWDCRKPEWQILDRAVQAAAERGGSSIDQAWNL